MDKMEKMEKKRDIVHSVLDKVMMKNAGMKQSKMGVEKAIPKSSNIDYPSLYLDSKQAPDLKGYEVDDKVILVVKGKVVSHSVDEGPNRSNESFRVEINEIGCLHPKKMEMGNKM